MVTAQLQHPYVYADIPHLTGGLYESRQQCSQIQEPVARSTAMLRRSPEKEGWCDTVITVADNGIGMSQEFQKHIFEPFERERTSTVSKVGRQRHRDGHREKAGRADGRHRGSGEQDRCWLQVYRDHSPPHCVRGGNTGETGYHSFRIKKSLSGTKILLAEDNDLNAEIAVELLQEEGCTVDRAKDGVEVWICWKKLRTEPIS